jgi:ankyrin repeat protein
MIQMRHLLLTGFVLGALGAGGCGPGAGEIIAAVESGELEQVKALVEEKPSLVNASGNTGMTPLHWAAAKDQGEILEYLIEMGADVNKKNHIRETPLDVAKRKRKGEMQALLQKHGGKYAKDL